MNDKQQTLNITISNTGNSIIEKVDIESVEKHKVILNLKKDNFNIDKNSQYMLVSCNVLNNLIKKVAQSEQKSMNLVIEKEIMKLMPIDIEDIKAVLANKIQEKYGQIKLLDDKTIKKLINSVYKEHPNLFYSLNDIR